MSRVISAVSMMVMFIVMLAFGTNVPQMINYQGRLVNSSGEPLDTTVSMIFTIYDAADAGVSKWSETHLSVVVTDGLFNVILGSENDLPDTVFAGAERYLGITVGDDTELSPRTRLVSTGYAHRVSSIDGAEAGVLSGIVEIGPAAAKDGRVADPALVVRGNEADSVVISPVDDITLSGTNDAGDQTILIMSNANGASVLVTATDVAKGTVRTVEIAPGDSIALAATEANGDQVVLITADPSGGAVYVTATDAAKLDPNTVTGSVTINKDGIFIVNETGSDTTIAITSDGSIESDGQLATGENNTASGDSSSISGGYNNTATGIAATVGGGGDNQAIGDFSVVGGGLNNAAQGAFSAILGGEGNTIDFDGHYSFLFGIDSWMNLDSTFMVDMPYIHFGNMADGYEFPATDGSADQVLQTDGNGKLDWVAISGGGGGWVDDGTSVHLEAAEDSVGIGLTTPTEKLDVLGSIRARTKIKADGDIEIGSTIIIDASAGQIRATGGTIDFDDDDITTEGSANIGPSNFNIGLNSMVLGSFNIAGGDYSVVSGGGGATADDSNSAAANYTTVSGGSRNSASAAYATVGGGARCNAAGVYSVVAGGGGPVALNVNSASGDWSAVGGGRGNLASGGRSVVSGGERNTASGLGAFIAAGGWNLAQGIGASVGGGRYNNVYGDYSLIAGGGGATDVDSNSISGNSSTIGGGLRNVIEDNNSTISGGRENSITGSEGSIVGGWGNSVGFGGSVGGGLHNAATGLRATIPGGYYNRASGAYSFAAGIYAKAVHDRTVVITAASGSDSTFSAGINQMVLRADSGIYITNVGDSAIYDASKLINTSSGAYLTTGGIWQDNQKGSSKTNIKSVDSGEIMEKLRQLTVSEWNHVAEGEKVRRLGPMGEDFYNIFGLGVDENSISPSDLAGVALAAIQELDSRTRELEAARNEVEQVKLELAELTKLVGQLLSEREESGQ
jgi:hypothetical protein